MNEGALGGRSTIQESIGEAVTAREKAAHEDALDEAFEKHAGAGGTNADWAEPFKFDPEAAAMTGLALAARAVSRDASVFAAACEEIEAMGLDLIDLIGEAYRSYARSVTRHDDKLQELERRRREVKRDFDGLHKARPAEAEVIEAEVIEG